MTGGIFFRTRTGCPWRDLPGRSGNWKTVCNRHRRWSGDGTWEMILDRLRAGYGEAEGQAQPVAADPTVVRRSRGGLVGKIHLLIGSGCRPLALVTSAGQRHDSWPSAR